jgi:hypothetical protein
MDRLGPIRSIALSNNRARTDHVAHVSHVRCSFARAPQLVETQESFGANQRDAALALIYRQTSARN